MIGVNSPAPTDTKQKLHEVEAAYAEACEALNTTTWCGHPKQIDAARRMFELWPQVTSHLKSAA